MAFIPSAVTDALGGLLSDLPTAGEALQDVKQKLGGLPLMDPGAENQGKAVEDLAQAGLISHADADQWKSRLMMMAHEDGQSIYDLPGTMVPPAFVSTAGAILGAPIYQGADEPSLGKAWDSTLANWKGIFAEPDTQLNALIKLMPAGVRTPEEVNSARMIENLQGMQRSTLPAAGPLTIEEAEKAPSAYVDTFSEQFPQYMTEQTIDPVLEAELTYATVNPRELGLDDFGPGRVAAAQESIAGRLERGENVAEITQAMANPKLLTENVKGGAWGGIRDFLLGSAQASGFTPSVRVPVEKTEDTTFSDLLKAAKLESTRVRTPRPRGMPIPKDTAINRLMQLDTPRIPFSEPEGARGVGSDTRQYLLNRQFGTGTDDRAPMVDTFAPPETPSMVPVTNEEAMASDVAQALANTDQPVQQNLQALAALAQTDPSIAERYVPGSQALQDITTQVESFSEPRVEWTPPKKKEVKKVKGPTKAQKAATRKANQAANKKLLAAKVKARDIQKAKNAAIREKKLAARESAKQAKERKAAEKALAVQRQHEKMARVEELKRHEQMLRFADESRKAYLARKKQEDELREAQGYGWGDMFT